jgi:prepilin-type N-terminal cleavage/methylation domain-containing protein
MSRHGRHARLQCRAILGFTLVELLVVIAILAALASIALPAIAAARAREQMIQCESNVHTLLVALGGYAASNEGEYPPNFASPAPGEFWHDRARIGQFLSCNVASDKSLIGGVMVCPADDRAQRSYAMNVWASSKVDSYVRAQLKISGTLWDSRVTDSSQMILISEKWTSSAMSDGWVTVEAFGYAGGATPGERFGVGGGIPPQRMGQWGLVNCELAYERHRSRSAPAMLTQPVGRITIGYADGHVDMKSNDDLADSTTHLSTLDSMWSPWDVQINH